MTSEAMSRGIEYTNQVYSILLDLLSFFQVGIDYSIKLKWVLSFLLIGVSSDPLSPRLSTIGWLFIG